MTEQVKKTINSILMGFVGVSFSTFTIMMGILANREAENTELLNKMNVFIEKRATISDDAIKKNDEDHIAYDLKLLNHDERITDLEKQTSVLKGKLNMDLSYKQQN